MEEPAGENNTSAGSKDHLKPSCPDQVPTEIRPFQQREIVRNVLSGNKSDKKIESSHFQVETIKSVEEMEREINSSGRDISVEFKVKEDFDVDGNLDKDPELFVTFEKQHDCTDNDGELDCVEKETELCPVFEKNTFPRANTEEVPETELQTEVKEIEREVKVDIEQIRKKMGKPTPSNYQDEVMKHPLLPPCQCNKRRCGDQYSYEMRSLIHSNFWTMNMYDRREWIKEYLLYLKPKSRTNHPVSSLHESHRKFFLPNLSEKKEVCRRMFFSTLGFKDEAKFLQNPKLLNKKGMLSRTRKRKCIMSRKNLRTVEEYCKELSERHGGVELPGTSNQELKIPTGFSFRDMYNDFCLKRSISSFGYHRFRQILELILRGEKVEDSEYADLREDEDDKAHTPKKRKKTQCDKSNDVTVTKKVKGNQQKKAPRQLTRRKKNKRSILKLPMFDEIKNDFLRKTKPTRKVTPTGSTKKRYNFREGISVVKSYSEDYMGDYSLFLEVENGTFHESTDEQNVSNEKAFLSLDEQNLSCEKTSRSLEIKPKTKTNSFVMKSGKRKRKAKKVSDVMKSCKSKRKAKNDYNNVVKETNKVSKQRKKKIKSEIRLAQIEFAETRKKSGSNHPVLPPCKCNYHKCFEKISETQRWVIHDDFWTMTSKQEKKKWIQKYISHCKPRSRSNFIKFPRKHLSKKYFLPSEEGKLTSVCRVFFMRTLGYHSNMTIDSVDMVSGVEVMPAELSLEIEEKNNCHQKIVDNNTKDRKSDESATENDDDFAEDTENREKELNAETGNIDEQTIYKDESRNELNEETGDESFPSSKNAEKVFFTPDIEKEEVEKAVNPATRRRRPLSLRNSKEHHPMRAPCHCSKKCPVKILQDRREVIHEHYWSLITYNQRKQWILDHIKREVPKRRTVLSGPMRKKETRKCYLPDWDGNKVEVCRGFFLATLGFKWDKMIDTICKTTPQDSKYVRADQRGRRAPVHKLPNDTTGCIREYLEAILQTFPFIPPQPRDPLKSGTKKKKKKPGAPVQSGLTIKTLYADYKAKHPNQKVSYASFRKIHCEVRDLFKSQNPIPADEEDVAETDINSSQVEELNHPPHVSTSPESDHGFAFDTDNSPPDPRRMNSNATTITPLQSCMYNEQPQLLNLSHPDSIAKHSQSQIANRLGKEDFKLSKPEDLHHLLPFSSAGKGHVYQIPSYSSSNIIPQFSAAQNNPRDPFHMAAPSQSMSNSITYSNLHFPTDLINHPHLHPHPSHYHPPHIYQQSLPYRDHSRFPASVLPQVLKEHNHNHHFYPNPPMEFGQDNHPSSHDGNVYSTLMFPPFTPDVTHPPATNPFNQIPPQPPFAANNNSNNNSVNSLDQRNDSNSNHDLPGNCFVQNPIDIDIKVSDSAEIDYFSREVPDHLAGKSVMQEKKNSNVKKPSRKRKKDDGTPKVKKIRKVRPMSNRNSKEHHPMLPPCICGKKCFEKISQNQREVIYDAFWELGSYNNRKQWIAEHMTREDPKRRTNLESPIMRKKETRRFTFQNSSNEVVEVCRLFFLHTLGLKWDKIIGTICKTTARDEPTVPPDMRGRKAPAHKLDEEVTCSVESYTRALVQAAKPDYIANMQMPDNPKKFTLDTFIPYGLTMKNLHQDYKAKHPSHKVSYESFRKIFRHIRKTVLDPDPTDAEQNDESKETADSVSPEPIEGTVNAATGHIDA